MPPNRQPAPPSSASGQAHAQAHAQPHAQPLVQPVWPTQQPLLPPVPAAPPSSTAAVTADAPDPVIVQAARDLAAGQVDTDLHATAGLDADRRARLVPGPGGKPPGPKA